MADCVFIDVLALVNGLLKNETPDDGCCCEEKLNIGNWEAVVVGAPSDREVGALNEENPVAGAPAPVPKEPKVDEGVPNVKPAVVAVGAGNVNDDDGWPKTEHFPS